MLAFLVGVQSMKASADAPNVTASQSTIIVFSGGTASANFSVTGMSVSISGLLPGVTARINVTTQTLNAPSSGVLSVPSAGTVLYYNVNVALPSAVYNYAAVPNAAVAISVSNPSIASGYTFEYWNGSRWVEAFRPSVSGTTITGLIPLSNLIGNVAAVESPTTSANSTSAASATITGSSATSTPSSATSVALLDVGAVIIVVVVVVAGFLMMRSRRQT